MDNAIDDLIASAFGTVCNKNAASTTHAPMSLDFDDTGNGDTSQATMVDSSLFRWGLGEAWVAFTPDGYPAPTIPVFGAGIVHVEGGLYALAISLNDNHEWSLHATRLDVGDDLGKQPTAGAACLARLYGTPVEWTCNADKLAIRVAVYAGASAPDKTDDQDNEHERGPFLFTLPPARATEIELYLFRLTRNTDATVPGLLCATAMCSVPNATPYAVAISNVGHCMLMNPETLAVFLLSDNMETPVCRVQSVEGDDEAMLAYKQIQVRGLQYLTHTGHPSIRDPTFVLVSHAAPLPDPENPDAPELVKTRAPIALLFELGSSAESRRRGIEAPDVFARITRIPFFDGEGTNFLRYGTVSDSETKSPDPFAPTRGVVGCIEGDVHVQWSENSMRVITRAGKSIFFDGVEVRGADIFYSQTLPSDADPTVDNWIVATAPQGHFDVYNTVSLEPIQVPGVNPYEHEVLRRQIIQYVQRYVKDLLSCHPVYAQMCRPAMGARCHFHFARMGPQVYMYVVYENGYLARFIFNN